MSEQAMPYIAILSLAAVGFVGAAVFAVLAWRDNNMALLPADVRGALADGQIREAAGGELMELLEAGMPVDRILVHERKCDRRWSDDAVCGCSPFVRLFTPVQQATAPRSRR